jgi:hypothetical protein
MANHLSNHAIELGSAVLDRYNDLVESGFSERGAIRLGELTRACEDSGTDIPPDVWNNLLDGTRYPYRWEVIDCEDDHEFMNPHGYRLKGIVWYPDPINCSYDDDPDWMFVTLSPPGSARGSETVKTAEADSESAKEDVKQQTSVTDALFGQPTIQIPGFMQPDDSETIHHTKEKNDEVRTETLHSETQPEPAPATAPLGADDKGAFPPASPTDSLPDFDAIDAAEAAKQQAVTESDQQPETTASDLQHPATPLGEAPMDVDAEQHDSATVHAPTDDPMGAQQLIEASTDVVMNDAE